MYFRTKIITIAAVLTAGLTTLAFKTSDLRSWPFSAPSVQDHTMIDVNADEGGEIAFNSTNGTFYGWTGSNWSSLAGATTPNLMIRSVTATDTASDTDDVLLLSGSSFSLTLFTAVGHEGKVLTIMHQGTSLSQVYTLATQSSQTIGGVAGGSYLLYTNSENLKLISDGSNWRILDHKTETEWIQYIPTFVNLGTPSTTTFYWRRQGDSILIRGSATVGTVAAASPAAFTLPASASINTAKIPGDQQAVLGKIVANVTTAGTTYPGASIGPWMVTYDSTQGANYLAISDRVDIDNTLFDLRTASSFISANSALTFESGLIPVSGWQP